MNYNEQEHQDFEKIVIELKNRMVTLKVLPFDTDIDTEEIFKIDYNNIVGEILTWNTMFHRIANLKSEMEYLVKIAEFDLKVFESQLYEEYKKKLVSDGEKATEKSLEMAILRDPRYIAKKKNLIESQKSLSHTENLYWSAQNKVGNLRGLSDKIRPEEFMGELLQDTINGVMIKATEKLIK